MDIRRLEQALDLGLARHPRPLKDHRRVPGLDEMLSAFDFEPIAFNMTLRNYDYMAHGGDSEFTLRRNREAFEWVDLVTRPGVYGAETRSASRRTLVLVNKPAETVAPCYGRRLRARPTADRWPPIGRRKFQAAMRAMVVVVLNERGQGSRQMIDTANQQPV